jgi:flagellar biogenesis protein FliO
MEILFIIAYIVFFSWVFWRLGGVILKAWTDLFK